VTSSRQPWYVNDPAGKQVAGFVKQYKQLTLTTIKVSMKIYTICSLSRKVHVQM